MTSHCSQSPDSTDTVVMTYSTTDANASYQEMLTDRANESAPPHPRAVALENLDSSTPSAFFFSYFFYFFITCLWLVLTERIPPFLNIIGKSLMRRKVTSTSLVLPALPLDVFSV